ncbi:YggS family pyridoxal phosphate-dependent enzyme [Chitinophagales bacterium]|nr:YggS family pyridoxal phosphate-dependent enzyme [Chitinophagales bacterium]
MKDLLREIRADLAPYGAQLVAVSKTKPKEAVQEAYDLEQRIFGENRVQEMSAKHEDLAKDIQWHLIGSLQRNKVKYIAPFVSLIHSVDELKLLAEINKKAAQSNRTIDCLLQFHIAQESTKFGLKLNEARELLASDSFTEMKNVRIVGLMGMASFSDDHKQVSAEFRSLRMAFEELKSNFFPEEGSFKELSMGMSGDYKIALEEGSTLVRIGSRIFGSR